MGSTIVQQTADISELKDLVESWEATAEILGDRALKKSLERGKQEIAKGKWIEWEMCTNELGICLC